MFYGDRAAAEATAQLVTAELAMDDRDTFYAGMIVGEHTRGNDLEVNVLKGKKLTNIRAAGKDENVQLTPPLRLSLEQALAFIKDDELVEITPKEIRLRKAELDPHARKRAARRGESAA